MIRSVDRVPEELWMEVHNIVQEAVTKTIPEKNKCKKAKGLSEELFTNSWGKEKSERKGRKERYTKLNAELQRIARTDNKAFLNEQGKEKQQNGKTRDLFKKTGAIKGTFQSRMGMIKDRNSKDLTETEEIKVIRIHRSTIQKRSYHDCVVTHLESHNLECEVKWALASIITIKASEGDGIPVELLQILKNDAIKVLHSICQQIWKT